MQMIRALAFILTAAALLASGCKADNPKASSANDPLPSVNIQPTRVPHDPAPAAAADPLIVCFGDSLTAGYGIDDPANAYPADLQRNLIAEGFHYRVANLGVSGETTKDGLARINRVIARHPEIVVLEFGGNDGLRGVPTEETQANLTAMVRQLQAAGITVALAGITLPPQYGPYYVGRFNAMYPALAAKFHTPLLPMLLVHVYDVPGSMQQDGVHPTAQGARQVAANVEQLIKPLLKK